MIRRLLAQEAERTAAQEKLNNLKLQVDAKLTLNSQTEGLLVGFQDAAVQPVFFLKKDVAVEKLNVFIHVRTCATLKPRGARSRRKVMLLCWWQASTACGRRPFVCG